MHIAFDSTPLKSGHKARGVGSYTRLLVEALQKTKTKHSFYFFTRGNKLPDNIDLIHYPYFDPFFLTLPLVKPIPCVVTVHDLIPVVYSERFPRGIKGEIKWFIQRMSLSAARRIVTDSEASKLDIASITGVAKDHIDVVYLAPSSVFKPVGDQKILKSVKERYVLPAHFILYVGDVNWNKNIPGLLEAFALITRTQRQEDTKLVLVGKAFLDENLAETQHVNQKIHQLNIEKHIIKLGFVKDEDLASLYSSASVYVQPSFAEGFGLPVLEAMACGCPVVTADVSSLSEIAGPAIRVNPANPASIADGILSILGTDTRVLAKKSIAWAKEFTWEKVAHQTIAVYEKALAGN